MHCTSVSTHLAQDRHSKKSMALLSVITKTMIAKYDLYDNLGYKICLLDFAFQGKM